MNQRIKELAEQAKLFTGWPNGETEYQKFAELIVKECASLVVDDNNAYDMLKHFGVEE